MQRFILKKFSRISGSTVGKLVCEWSILAGTDGAAIREAGVLLSVSEFDVLHDFAILWNAAGKIAWERVADA